MDAWTCVDFRANHQASACAIRWSFGGWDSVTSSVESLGDHEPEAALVFDCAGRRRVLGHGQAQEVKAITESFGEPPPLAGLYTDGEVARTRGTKGDHNHSVVTVTFA